MANREPAFVSLESFVRTPREQPEPHAEGPVAARMPAELEATIHETRRFRAALADALEAGCENVLRDFASDVLARELTLAPAAIARVAQAALERFWEEEPLALLAHPDEARYLEGLAIPVRTDASLRHGDVTLALRYGSIDLTLGVRLAHVLEIHRDRTRAR